MRAMRRSPKGVPIPLFTMSATDLLRRWFENDIFIGLQAVNGIIGTWAGPDAPGTAYVLMHHSVGDNGDGETGSWGYPETPPPGWRAF